MWKSQYSSNIYVAKWQSLSIDHEAGPPAQRADPRLHTTENHIKHEVAEAEYVVLEGSHDDDSVGRKPVIGCARAYPHDGHKSIAPKSPLSFVQKQSVKSATWANGRPVTAGWQEAGDCAWTAVVGFDFPCLDVLVVVHPQA